MKFVRMNRRLCAISRTACHFCVWYRLRIPTLAAHVSLSVRGHPCMHACDDTTGNSWSVSFYPQVLLNFRRKTSVGLSFDFLLYNVLAFSCYSAFTCEWTHGPRSVLPSIFSRFRRCFPARGPLPLRGAVASKRWAAEWLDTPSDNGQLLCCCPAAKVAFVASDRHGCAVCVVAF